jgi:Flp pilus assembly protein protease CpaA
MFDVLTLGGYFIFALIISRSDIKYRIISNRSLVLFAIFSILCNLKILDSTLLICVGLGIFLIIAIHIIFRGRIGPGDLKLFWVMTIWAPIFSQWLGYFAWAWILGGIFSIATFLHSRKFGGSIPFAPFVFLAFLPSI